MHSKIRILKLETSMLNLSSCILKLRIEVLSEVLTARIKVSNVFLKLRNRVLE